MSVTTLDNCNITTNGSAWITDQKMADVYAVNCNGSMILPDGKDNGQTEPKTYNWPALFLFLIMLIAIAGNSMVCLAVKFERKLRNMFNFFLVSLAISDMMCATVVMPVSILKAFLGR